MSPLVEKHPVQFQQVAAFPVQLPESRLKVLSEFWLLVLSESRLKVLSEFPLKVLSEFQLMVLLEFQLKVLMLLSEFWFKLCFVLLVFCLQVMSFVEEQ